MLKKLFTIALPFSLLFYSASALAAGVTLRTPSPSEQGNIAISVSLDAQKDDINAVDGYLDFPSEHLQVANINDSNSIVSLWLDRPALTEDDKPRIHFSGIIPGGFRSSDGFLFVVNFKSLDDKPVNLSVSQIKILKNDGKGTQTSVRPVTISVNPQNTKAPLAETQDLIPPEDFTILIGREPSIYNNQWFAAFATQDKQSGIDRYEIAEKQGPPVTDYSSLDWRPATTPALLKDQTLQSTVYVRVFDLAGNVRTSVLGARKAADKGYFSSNKDRIILIGIAAVVLFIIFLLFKHLFKEEKEAEEEGK